MPFHQNMQDIENIKGDVAILATGDHSYFGVSTVALGLSKQGQVD